MCGMYSSYNHLYMNKLRIEHGGLGVKRGALFKELYIYSFNYESFV